MTITTISRRLEWDAGHRVYGHESKCNNLHGHRYVAEVTVTAPGLDTVGRIIDFSCIKELIGRYIDKSWDHNLMLHPDDPLNAVIDANPSAFNDRAPYVMKYGNPTAENIAHELFDIAVELLGSHDVALTVTSVKVWETPNCSCEYTNASH